MCMCVTVSVRRRLRTLPVDLKLVILPALWNQNEWWAADRTTVVINKCPLIIALHSSSWTTLYQYYLSKWCLNNIEIRDAIRRERLYVQEKKTIPLCKLYMLKRQEYLGSVKGASARAFTVGGREFLTRKLTWISKKISFLREQNLRNLRNKHSGFVTPEIWANFLVNQWIIRL
jgi:hypothetical protein